MVMKKELVKITIALHYIQARIINGLNNGTIDLKTDSLREIAKNVKAPKCSPQQVKHHLEQFVKMGAIDYVNGDYSFTKTK